MLCLKSLWDVVKASNEPGHTVPLPSSAYGAFTIFSRTHHLYDNHHAGSTTTIGRCVGALLVRKLVSDLKSRNVPASDVELTFLSNILGTQNDNVKRWLKHPSAIELVAIVSLNLDIFDSLDTNVVPPHTLDIVQQSLDLISRPLPTELIAQRQLDQTIRNCGPNFENFVSSRLKKFLNAYKLNTPSPPTVRASCLQICLKSLWYFARLYHRHVASMPLLPNIARFIQTEDPTTRVIRRCFEALVVDKLVADVNPLNCSLTHEDVAYLSAILGLESDIVRDWLGQPGAIILRNVVSFILGENNALVADQLPADVVEIFQQTLSTIAKQIARGRGSAGDDLYMDQVSIFHDVGSTLAKEGPDWLKYQLEWILSQLPAVDDRSGW